MFENSLEFAQKMDREDALREWRDRFFIPTGVDGLPSTYLCGNSLGLQPKSASQAVNSIMSSWAERGVEGYFTGAEPWVDYADDLRKPLSRLVGASPLEVTLMNTLTVNLNLLLVSFYRPNSSRFKIIIEEHTFPSDQYAIRQQIAFHGYDPSVALVVLKARTGEEHLRMDDILETIDREGDRVALVLMGGLNYYTGQLFDMRSITERGHANGAVVGFDLAHAAGNVPLSLHEWGPDFAVWCHYKYVNGGPAAPGGAFVHDRHARAFDLPRFSGWWGHNRDTRFQWVDDYEPEPGAAGWQMTNAPVLSTATVKASLEIFEEVGLTALRKKSKKLTGFLRFLLNEIGSGFEIMTPDDSEAHGAQLSLRVTTDNGRAVFDHLKSNGVICDWRNPNCIRASPAPLYNSFEDVYRFYQVFQKGLELYN